MKPEKSKLVHRVLRAGGWTIFGFGASQLLRLGGNLILTRLLFPEAFGLMAIVQAVLVGVALLSDIGIEQSIIHNKRGNEPAFVNTAWTLKVIRGVLTCVVILLLAQPVASFYGEPMLAQLLRVVGFIGIIAGLGSTKFATANRNLSIGKTTMIDLGSYAFGMAVTLIWAWLDRSIWSLVIGNVIGATVKTVASHVWLDGIGNRFSWERESLGVLLSFGRWIFVSSALTFLAGEGIRLLIGDLLDVKSLAFFSLAVAMDQIPRRIAQQVGGGVLFPAYSEVMREKPERLYAVLAKSRLIQIVPSWLASVALVYFGQDLMEFLYDGRYKDSGWMLQLLALGSLVGCLSSPYSAVLWAKGMVRTSTVLLAVQILVQILAMVVGAHFWGARGLVLAVALTSWLMYPAHAFVYAGLSLWQPKIDLPVIAASLLIAISVLSNQSFLR